jgi:hypothetical protein
MNDQKSDKANQTTTLEYKPLSATSILLVLITVALILQNSSVI